MTTLTGNRIIRLQAENFKRLTAIDITPEGNIVEIRGLNAAGKTSILDAIWMTLSYTAGKKDTPKPVKDGAESAYARIEFDTFIATRTWSKDGKSNLRLESPEGLQYGSPQKLLDEALGALTFDPLVFVNAAEKDRLRMLLEVVDLPFDPDTLAAQRKQMFDDRTAVNRRVKELEAQVAGVAEPVAGLPDVEQSSGDVIGAMSRAQDTNRRRDEAENNIRAAEGRVNRLEVELAEARQAGTLWATTLAELPARANVAVFQSRLEGLESLNAKVRAAAARSQLTVQLDKFRTDSTNLTKSIEDLEASKAEAMRNTVLPVEGLGFDEDGVTFTGQPFTQASGAEQLRVSMGIAMALNPGIRILRIKDASLLDSLSRALVEEMAVEHDFQIWLEVVSEDGSVGVLIEDGQVVNS